MIDEAVIEGLARRILAGSRELSIERVAEGVSTYVYRLRRGGEVFYLRVLPEEGAGFAPEAYAHDWLRQRGVRVPDVIYVEHCNAALERSVMVTTAIPGQPIGRCSLDAATRHALVEAGRDLAVINSTPVEGFGWVSRDNAVVNHLEAEYSTYRAFALHGLENDLQLLGRQALNQCELAAGPKVIDRHDAWLDVARARLAHGDFDTTHIYVHEGRYSGIIDFGEIRGGDPWYDLAHFKIHDGETLPALVLPSLLEGYREVTGLPPDYERRIAFSSLFIAVKALARRIRKTPSANLRGDRNLAAIRDALKVLQT